jgi:misacylated tRNA(Ala) deacylase
VQVVDGKKVKLNGYEVILEDTILFPEGGGQPDDRGTINGVNVLNVSRRGAVAVHFTSSPIDQGVAAEVRVDWDRRWDHMQQHSGQHLVTAVASSEYGFATTSWNLGEKVSSIELDTPEVTPEQLANIERIVNEKIKAAVAMYPKLYESKDDPELTSVRTRGLPDDHVGAIRVVTIDGIETNMCCGTHVSNLCHLQAIKLLCVEKGKKCKSNLIFVAGERVLKYLSACYDRERAFNALLKGQPDDYVELIQKLQNSFKLAQKNATSLLKDVAKFEADRIKASVNGSKFVTLHKKEGDNEFMNSVAREVGNEILLFLTTGEEKGAGLFLLSGPESDVKTLGPKVAELLDGKGAGNSGRYQGRANRMQKRPDVESLLKDYFAQQADAES